MLGWVGTCLSAMAGLVCLCSLCCLPVVYLKLGGLLLVVILLFMMRDSEGAVAFGVVVVAVPGCA